MTDFTTTAPHAEQVEADTQHPRDALVIAGLEERLRAAQSEQIIDGADARLERFWERAGRIADAAGFCDEYDRIADELNGPGRTRDWDVTVEVTATVRVSVSVNARDEDDAFSEAHGSIDTEIVTSAIEDGGIDDWNFNRSISAERS